MVLGKKLVQNYQKKLWTNLKQMNKIRYEKGNPKKFQQTQNS